MIWLFSRWSWKWLWFGDIVESSRFKHPHHDEL